MCMILMEVVYSIYVCIMYTFACAFVCAHTNTFSNMYKETPIQYCHECTVALTDIHCIECWCMVQWKGNVSDLTAAGVVLLGFMCDLNRYFWRKQKYVVLFRIFTSFWCKVSMTNILYWITTRTSSGGNWAQALPDHTFTKQIMRCPHSHEHKI